MNHSISGNLLETYVRLFQIITLICFQQDEKNWNNAAILDQFFFTVAECSAAIQSNFMEVALL
jgi:hypothetical protein